MQATHTLNARAIFKPVAGKQVRMAAPRPVSLTMRARHSVKVYAAVAVVDPATKLSFAEELNGLKCLGAGVREKKIAFMGVKVYSVALYVDAAAAGPALKSGKSLLSGEFDKLVSIKLAMKVDGPTFWKALDEALMPRIAQIATDMATAEDENGNFMSEVAERAEIAEAAAQDGAKALGTFLSSQSLDVGTEILLRWSTGGKLEASVGGAKQAFESNELCKALFDVYLGSDPVSPQALAAFQAGAKAL